MSSALDRLDELEAEVERRRQAEDARRAEVRERSADLTGMRARLDSYERSVGAGEREPDPEFEAEADRVLGAVGVIEVERTPHGRSPFTEVMDSRAAARLDGATAARADAEAALTEYAAANVDALSAEAAVGARADHDAVVDALVALDAALGPVRLRDGRLRAVRRLAGASPLDYFAFRELCHAVGDQFTALDGVRKLSGFEPVPPDECGCGKPLTDPELVGLGDPVCADCATGTGHEPEPTPAEPAGSRASGEGFAEGADL